MISCCIDMMFSYCDFYDRFDEVRNCGMDTVEFWKWTNKDIDRICEILKNENIWVDTCSSFNFISLMVIMLIVYLYLVYSSIIINNSIVTVVFNKTGQIVRFYRAEK